MQFTQLGEFFKFTPGASWIERLPLAALVFVVSWVVAATTKSLVRRAARTEWFVRLLIRSGILSGLAEPSLLSIRTGLAGALRWLIVIAGSLAALAILSDEAARKLTGFLVEHLPGLLAGLLTMTCSWWLAGYCSRSVLINLTNDAVPYPWRWASLVRWAIFAAGIALASEMTGFATVLIRSGFLIFLTGLVLSLAFAVSPLLRDHLALINSNAETPRKQDLYR